MPLHHVRVHASKETLPREEELAWILARTAADKASIGHDVKEMVINRLIDNAAVALAAINRSPVVAARTQALAHPSSIRGACLLGMPCDVLVHPEWAAWANGTAVRELDFHDTFLAADYSHPADNIPAVLATAQALNRSGDDLIYGIVAAYEIQVNLVKSICLHRYKKDHIAHLGPSVVAGIGALLELPVEVIYQGINQALHTTCATRQSRKGLISSWKAYAPAFAGKMGIEAVDRAMRKEKSPAPIYEGEDAVMAWMLGGEEYDVFLPELNDSKEAILQTYTKEHSAEYQAQAMIDLAFKLKKRITDISQVERIILHTSHHTHFVIGTGSGDPQKMDPHASRETLDHSIMYIFAVALQDGSWHHEYSYTADRAQRKDTVDLWQKISTVEDSHWSELYHSKDPAKKAFGGRVVIIMKNGKWIEDEIKVPNAHPQGDRPFKRNDYIRKFSILVDGIVSKEEQQRFLEDVQNLSSLGCGELHKLNIVCDKQNLLGNKRNEQGIF